MERDLEYRQRDARRVDNGVENFNSGSRAVGATCFCPYSVAWVARRSCPSLGRSEGRGAEIAATASPRTHLCWKRHRRDYASREGLGTHDLV